MKVSSCFEGGTRRASSVTASRDPAYGFLRDPFVAAKSLVLADELVLLTDELLPPNRSLKVLTRWKQ
jgi:hypothetical protein